MEMGIETGRSSLKTNSGRNELRHYKPVKAARFGKRPLQMREAGRAKARHLQKRGELTQMRIEPSYRATDTIALVVGGDEVVAFVFVHD
jgi:hypothetical protein